ncbi:hypothetical protein HU200_041326 [Digitaria exilis]|uniref:Protein FAR1-RELATED SEQUENCE n=1 Tax=Digitaria exilis TaxID=1010633 RepID=A0A835B7N8_9POAL|nr:hypothetical protein HU200_041326 [Digitaria exilis]
MRSAIATVFPNTIHRNCFFHIKRKCYNKNLKVFAANEGLPETFEDIVNFSVTEEEFETRWLKMITDYKLENNKYFTKMWEMRNIFIPVYFKHDFFPFIQSTARSEGTNARFKDNVGPTYSVVSFLRQYQRIIDTIQNKEQIEDNQSKEKTPKELQYGYTIEKQAIELYNRIIYSRFANQLKQTENYKYKEIEEGRTFEVWYKSNKIRKRGVIRKYIVQIDLTKGAEEFSYICGKLNKDGIVCAHILKIIVEEEINEIPEKYYIERWSKKEKKFHIHRREQTSTTHRLLRFNMLSRQAAELTFKAAKGKRIADYLAKEFQRIGEELDIMLAEEDLRLETIANEGAVQTHSLWKSSSNGNQEIVSIRDPKRIHQKGRPKNPTRLMPMVEQERAKMAKKAGKNKNNKGNTSGKIDMYL